VSAGAAGDHREVSNDFRKRKVERAQQNDRDTNPAFPAMSMITPPSKVSKPAMRVR
jgi:hypothetical protein